MSGDPLSEISEEVRPLNKNEACIEVFADVLGCSERTPSDRSHKGEA